MFLSGSGTAPVITKSQISGSNIGIYTEASANPLIGGSGANANDIFNNIAYSVQNSGASPTINASYNWWGSGTGPLLTGVNKVSSGVDYSNYLATTAFGNTPFVPSSPQTTIGDGTLTGITTWTLAGSPYYINGNITVDSSATLTINSGVVVKFAPNVGLWIYGTLNASGTSGNKIYFTDYRDDSVGGDINGDGSATIPSPGWWRGINVLNVASATLNNCVVRYAGANN